MPASDINGHAGSHSTGDARIDLREETYSSSQEDLKRMQNDSILKRIPVGAEATTVLVSMTGMKLVVHGERFFYFCPSHKSMCPN